MRSLCLVLGLTACATDHRPDYWLDQDPSLGGSQVIFNHHCLVGCHSGDKPMGALNLEAGYARDQLVGVKTVSYCDVDTRRVIPGDLEHSCLWILLEKDTMPVSAPPLQPFQKETIYRWILDGAPE